LSLSLPPPPSALPAPPSSIDAPPGEDAEAAEDTRAAAEAECLSPRLSPSAGRAVTARYLYKRGDNLFQDVLVLMLLDEMNALWRAAGSAAFTLTYAVVPTAERAGFIELLPEAVPIKAVPDFTYSRALHHSAAGAFIAGFVLGLADRHQDNMLLVGPRRDIFVHIDFGYVAGARPWFDANLLPIPERFYRCLTASGKWDEFLNDCVFAFTILQANRAALIAIAQTFVEPLVRAGYPEYIDNVLQQHTPDQVRELVQAAPNDLARRFKNMHHKLSH